MFCHKIYIYVVTLAKGSFKKYVCLELPIFDPPSPCSFLLVLHGPLSSSMYIRFSELPHSQKKFHNAYDAYFE